MPLFLETLTETKAFICRVELDFLPKSRILLVYVIVNYPPP